MSGDDGGNDSDDQPVASDEDEEDEDEVSDNDGDGDANQPNKDKQSGKSKNMRMDISKQAAKLETAMLEEAAKNAVEKAGQTLRDLRVAEVSKLDMKVEDGKVAAYRARVNLSFKYGGGE